MLESRGKTGGIPFRDLRVAAWGTPVLCVTLDDKILGDGTCSGVIRRLWAIRKALGSPNSYLKAVRI